MVLLGGILYFSFLSEVPVEHHSEDNDEEIDPSNKMMTTAIKGKAPGLNSK